MKEKQKKNLNIKINISPTPGLEPSSSVILVWHTPTELCHTCLNLNETNTYNTSL